jgi:DNA-binding NarL/FixJ family response regulator
MAISVFLADDNLIVREGAKALLDLEDDLDVVGVAAVLAPAAPPQHRCDTNGMRAAIITP